IVGYRARPARRGRAGGRAAPGPGTVRRPRSGPGPRPGPGAGSRPPGEVRPGHGPAPRTRPAHQSVIGDVRFLDRVAGDAAEMTPAQQNVVELLVPVGTLPGAAAMGGFRTGVTEVVFIGFVDLLKYAMTAGMVIEKPHRRLAGLRVQ